MGNYHVPCGAGEKLEITSKVYLLQPIVPKVRFSNAKNIQGFIHYYLRFKNKHTAINSIFKISNMKKTKNIIINVC
jgi:hypothetical protein